MHRSGITLALLTAMLAACSNAPHNNVLLFGTDTKFGIDVSSAATQGGAPQFTVGYRRAEAVWMPLVVNQFDCAAESSDNASDCTVTSDATEDSKLQGATGDDTRDAYSVFASFGATFSGTATGTEASASGGLAQFFATGIAAQRLAENTGIESALKVNNPGAAEGEAKKAHAEAAMIEAEARLTKAQTEAVDAAVAEQTKVATAETTVILDRCGGPDKDAAGWKAKLAKARAEAGLTQTGERRLTDAKTNALTRGEFEQDATYRKSFIDNLNKLCPAS